MNAPSSQPAYQEPSLLKLEHLPSLDGLRGLAVLLVVPHNLRISTEAADPFAKLLTGALDRGWIGVQLFFVLSGFLISRILLRTQQSSNYYTGFYVRRGLRILPLYYATLFTLLVIAPMLGHFTAHDTRLDVYLWTFLSNYVQPFHPGGVALPHFWSLAVEEQFYLLWPLLLRHMKIAQILRLCLAITVGGLGTRMLLMYLQLPDAAVYEWTPCRMDALALGAGVAALFELPNTTAWIQRNANRVWLTTICILCIGFLASKGYSQFGVLAQTAGYSILALGFATLIMSVVSADLGLIRSRLPWLRHVTLRRVGRYSYGMYVIHVPVGTLLLTPITKRLGLLDQANTFTQYLYVLVGLVTTYLLAAAIYHFYERHFLAFKHRFNPRCG